MAHGITRQVKQELLQAVAPEYYPPLDDKRFKAKLKKELKKEVKPYLKKVKKGLKPIAEAPVIVGATAPRRPYRWKGRAVKKVLRPGTVVMFSPGQRSQVKGIKRSMDEVFADHDILEQAAQKTGEFAYGKRARILPLDTSNPTPALRPVTEQKPVLAAAPSSAVTLTPTVQMLVPRKRKLQEAEGIEEVVVKKEKLEPRVFRKPRSRQVAPKRRGVTKQEPMDTEVAYHSLKQVSPELAVQTIDVKVPVHKVEAMEIDEPWQQLVIKTEGEANPPALLAPGPGTAVSSTTTGVASQVPQRKRKYKPTNSIMPQYVLHPSLKNPEGYGRTYTPTAAASNPAPPKPKKAQKPKKQPTNKILPQYVLHPSIKNPEGYGRTYTPAASIPKPKKSRAPKSKPTNAIKPQYWVHPSISNPPGFGQVYVSKGQRMPPRLPEVRYHPSILRRLN